MGLKFFYIPLLLDRKKVPMYIRTDTESNNPYLIFMSPLPFTLNAQCP